MERGEVYCLSSAILASIYRGLGEICRFAHLGRKGGHIPWYFHYAWVTKYFRTYDFDDNVSSDLRMSKFSGFGQAKTFDVHGARTYSRGNSKRKRDISYNQNIQRDEGPSSLKPKLKIVRSQKPLRSPILETKDNTLLTKIPGVGATISATPISAVPIQSIAMLAQAPYEVKLTLDPSSATAYSRKMKSIVVCTFDEQGVSNVQGSKLNYGKTIFLPLDRAENIMDILDCDPSPTEYMVFRTLERLYYFKGEFDSLYDLINERGVINLKGQIDTLHAVEVIDPTTKASLEKTEAYVKESFEDLKTF
ncbi:hypothetical protein Cgig2_009664 [Carnegiea gigantea]|uniref:Uncharacterized protein n=1 Tax=Carnegiea gigantea TaxID=171969 RepID=A0A9Q1JS48_9CARY|nr:hypothetical protein Cgig2_009664 [Carnegiea gigantea]